MTKTFTEARCNPEFTTFCEDVREKKSSSYRAPQVILLGTTPETGIDAVLNETSNGVIES